MHIVHVIIAMGDQVRVPGNIRPRPACKKPTSCQMIQMYIKIQLPYIGIEKKPL